MSDNEDLVEIARVQGPFEADLIENFLGSHGIIVIVRGRTAPFVYPLTVDGMAEFKVFVERENAEKARELMTAMPAPDDVPDDPVAAGNPVVADDPVAAGNPADDDGPQKTG